MIIVQKQLCGLGKKNARLFGVGEEFTMYYCLFFTVSVWKDEGKIVNWMRMTFLNPEDKDFKEYMPQLEKARENIRKDVIGDFEYQITHLKREVEKLTEQSDRLNRRCSDLTNENETFRNVVKILNGEEGKYWVSHGFQNSPYPPKEN